MKITTRIIILLILVIVVVCFFVACSSEANRKNNGSALSDKNTQDIIKALDLSAIHKSGYTAGGIIPAGDKTALLCAVSSEPQSESAGKKTRLYAVNTETGNIWDKYIEAGNIEPKSRLNILCDDGTTAVIESSGTKKNIVFVDAKKMTAVRKAVPGEDIWEVAVSPDKAAVAFTTYDGTYLSDMDFSKIELLLPRKTAEPKNEEKDELSRAAGFTADSSQLLYHTVGYESDLGYGLFNISTRVNRYISLSDMSALFYSDNKLFLFKTFELTPVGYIDLSGTKDEIHKIEGLYKDAAQDTDVNPGSELIGSVRRKDELSQAKIYDGDGKLVSDVTIDNPFAESIRIADGSGTAVITTQESESKKAEVYLWKFRK